MLVSEEPATMLNVRETSSFLEKRKLSDLQEERSTKSPVVLWRVHKLTKKSVWLTNQRDPNWLKHKPDPPTSWYLKNRWTRTDVRVLGYLKGDARRTEEWTSAPLISIWVQYCIVLPMLGSLGGMSASIWHIWHKYVRDLCKWGKINNKFIVTNVTYLYSKFRI